MVPWRWRRHWWGRPEELSPLPNLLSEPVWISYRVSNKMKNWIQSYVDAQRKALESVPVEQIEQLVETLRKVHQEDRQVFVIGNGGSACNASHFAVDLGKGASDALGKRFRVLSLTDNVGWITALGNDYSYADIFVGQLQNYARAGDVVISISVSGNSPNCVKALEWCKAHHVHSVALVSAKRGKMAELADQTIVIGDTHYGRVEDVQMNLLHILCYAFMEQPKS